MKSFKKTAILLAVMLTFAMCFAFGASAEGELAEGAFTYTVANGKATIVKVDTSAEDGLFVPAELGGYPVDSIAADAFEGCDSLLTVHFCGTQGEWDIICAGNDVLAGKTLHLAEKVAGVPAKCEETGLTEGVRCAACDKWFTEQSEIPVLGHSFTDYQPDNNATIFADGTKTAYCDNGCGEWDTLPDEGSKIVFGKPESVTSVTTTSSITLNWTPVEGATGYRVFYKTASGWKKCTTLTATTHSFYKLKPASKYTFAVRAYNLTDGVVTWAPTYTTHETASQAVAPAKITVAQNTNAIRLNWTACPGATGYRIYYKLPSDTSWKVSVSTTGNTTHTYTKLKPGSKYDFAIRPYIKTADAVIWSAYTTYTATTTPATPYPIISSDSAASITVWLPEATKADGYALYYKINNGAYKLYKTYTDKFKVVFNNLDTSATYTFALRAGNRTSGGVVWSSYRQIPVKPIARCAGILFDVNQADFYADYTLNGKRTQIHADSGKLLGLNVVDDYGNVFRTVYSKKNNYWYVIYDDEQVYTIASDEQLGLEPGFGRAFIDTFSDLMSTARNLKYAKNTIGGKTYYTETCTSKYGNTAKFYYDTNNKLVRIDVKYYDGSSEIFYIHTLCGHRDYDGKGITGLPPYYYTYEPIE